MQSAQFNMPPKLMTYLARAQLINQYGTKFPASEILKDQQLIVLYFASVHDKDTALMERLRHLYETVRANSIRLEIVYVPTDLDAVQAQACFGQQGGWYSLLHGATVIDELLVVYNIIGTPTISVVKRDGTIVSRCGEDDLRTYGSNALVAWS